MKQSTKENLQAAVAAGAAFHATKKATQHLRTCPACHMPVAKNAYRCPHCGCNIDQLDMQKAMRPHWFIRGNVAIVKYVGIAAIVLVFLLALGMRALSS